MASINKAAPCCCVKELYTCPADCDAPLLFKSLRNGFTSPSRWEKPSHSSRVFSSGARGALCSAKSTKRITDWARLSSIADNVQRCVRCGHLTPTSNSCVGPATADAGSLLLGHGQESKWMSHAMWIPSDRLLLLPGFVSLACQWRPQRLCLVLKKTWNSCMTRVQGEAHLCVDAQRIQMLGSFRMVSTTLLPQSYTHSQFDASRKFP